MRKIFSLITVFCIGGAFTNAHADLFALNNTAESTTFFSVSTAQEGDNASGEKTETLDEKKSKIIGELNNKKNDSKKDVVKSYIEKSIDDINNATSAEQVDNISTLVLAKVNACLEVEGKQNSESNSLTITDDENVNNYYTRIINAADIEQVNSLKREVVDFINLCIMKKNDINEINSRFIKIPDEARNSSDAEKIDKFVNDISAAANYDDEANAYTAAKMHISAMEERADAISDINFSRMFSNVSSQANDFINVIIKNIVNSDDRRFIELSSVEAHAILNATKDQLNAINNIHKAMQVGKATPFLYNVVKNDIGDVLSTDDKGKMEGFVKSAENKLNAVLPAYKAGQSNALGTLGTPQDGPVIEVTDLEGNVIKLYHPKKANIIKN